MAAILQLSDAIEEFVHDEDTIALEGFTHLIPYAAGHEIIRQKRRKLTVIRMTPDVIYDQLIGAGCVAKSGFLAPSSGRALISSWRFCHTLAASAGA